MAHNRSLMIWLCLKGLGLERCAWVLDQTVPHTDPPDQPLQGAVLKHLTDGRRGHSCGPVPASSQTQPYLSHCCSSKRPHYAHSCEIAEAGRWCSPEASTPETRPTYSKLWQLRGGYCVWCGLRRSSNSWRLFHWSLGAGLGRRRMKAVDMALWRS